MSKLERVYHDEDFENIYNLALKTVTNMKSSADVLEYSSAISKYKEKIEMFLEIISSLFRDLLLLKNDCQNFVQNVEYANILLVISKSTSQVALLRIENEIQSAKQKLKFNANLSGTIDNLLLKILEIKHIC